MKRYLALLVLLFLKLEVQCFDDTVSLISRIIKEVFHNEILCYISDKNLFNNVLEKSFINSETEVVSLSYNHLKHVTENLPCSGYILTLQNGDDFIRYYKDQKKYTFAFKPWTRLLLMYEKPPLHLHDLYLPSILSALDVIVIDLPKQDEDVTVNVTSIYKNTTVLTWRPKQSTVDWAKFRPVKWTPGYGSLESNFTVVLFNCPPFVFLNEDGEVGRGVEVQVINEVIREIPIKYVVINSSQDIDQWMVSSEMVQTNVTDMAVCSQWYVNTYGKSLELSYPIRQICSTFLVKKPMLLPASSFVFQQLQGTVYLVTLLILLVLSLLLMTLQWYFYKNREKLDLTPDYVVYPFHLLRILSLGGVPKLTLYVLASSKCLLGFWCCYCLIFATYYSAGMTSCLTNPRYESNINTLQDMIYYKVHWFSKVPTYQDYLLGFNSPLYTTLADLFAIKHDTSDSIENAARIVKTVERRYVTEVEQLPQEVKKYYKVLDECMSKYYTGFLFQKNSPYTKVFDDTIIKLIESGIYDNWIDYILYRAEDEQRSFFTNYVEDPSTDIDLKKIQGAFFLLAGGYVLSFISFVAEYCLGKVVFNK